MGTFRVGDRVNMEVDVMAKYAERLLAGRMGNHDEHPAHEQGHR